MLPSPKGPSLWVPWLIKTAFPSYVPYTEEQDSLTSCGTPISYNASKEWADKKVVLFAVPGTLLGRQGMPRSAEQSTYDHTGAFTPSCSVQHLPGFIKNLDKIKDKGVNVVAVLAYNDPFVMSAWSKANGVKNDDIVKITKLSYIRQADWLAFLDRPGNQVLQIHRLDHGRANWEIRSHSRPWKNHIRGEGG